MSSILLVEDDKSLAIATSFALETEQFHIIHADCLAEARKALSRNQFDLILLDVNLPDGNGYEFCLEIRKQGHGMPVIFLTALDEEVNVIQGLDAGADDYITKPFRVRELISRIKANLRRYNAATPANDVLVAGPFRVHLQKYEILHNGAPLNLTPSEYRLFVSLIQNKDMVLTKEQILEQLWDIDGAFVDVNTLSVYIHRLREKLGEDKDCITTVRGVGYKFVEIEHVTE